MLFRSRLDLLTAARLLTLGDPAMEELADRAQRLADELAHAAYRFGEKTEPTTKHISKSSIDSILINSVIPFYYAYSRKFDLKKFADFALELLREIPAEKNRITREFSRLGIHSRNALQSQALTELKCRYCDVKRCYICKNNFEIW